MEKMEEVAVFTVNQREDETLNVVASVTSDNAFAGDLMAAINLTIWDMAKKNEWADAIPGIRETNNITDEEWNTFESGIDSLVRMQILRMIEDLATTSSILEQFKLEDGRARFDETLSWMNEFLNESTQPGADDERE